MQNEYENNLVVLTDEEGNEKEFEHIDTLEYNGSMYMAFIPAELSLEEEAEVVILKMAEADGEDVLESVDDDESLEVYNLLMERLDDLYEMSEDDD